MVRAAARRSSGEYPCQTERAQGTGWSGAGRGLSSTWIQARPEWDAELSDRVEYHFRTFDLAQRYAEFCVSMVTGNQWIHRKIRHESGMQALAAHLREDAEQHASTHGINAWDTALRYGLADSTWYHQHGVDQDP